MSIYVTKDDGFVWLDVTERIKKATSESLETLWNAHELFAIHDDDSESLLESHEEIDEALWLGLKIGIEVGHLPKRNDWWSKTEKITQGGYVYLRAKDLLKLWRG